MMKSIIHKAETRGFADHGWLKSHHSFSFANYYNPERIHFGLLRVLNDDTVAGGMGFGTHPHENMEIVSIPLSGDLEHQDSMGNKTIIRANDVQIMSAGTGVRHSEYNHNPDKPVKFFQIWVFPKEKNIKPRYDQKTFPPEERINRLQRVVSPDEPEAVWINQDAWFSIGNFTEGFGTEYEIRKEGNGVYLFVISGKVEVNGQHLETRDGMGIWEARHIPLKALSDAEILLMEIPMN